MYSNITVSQVSLPNSPCETKTLVDQNGNKYVELDCHFITSYYFTENYSVYQCSKQNSQGCMGKLASKDQSMMAMVIQPHSCRWSYDEASKFCYLRYGVNKYIKTGYHPPVQTWKDRWNLLWSIHSETGNIWTHAIGIIIAACYLWNTVVFLDSSDYWIWVFHDFVSFTLFVNSTIYHWLHTCSQTWCINLSSLDHCGLAGFALVSHSTWAYYGWRHKAFWFYFYAGILCTLFFLKYVIAMKNVVHQNFDYKLEDVRCKLIFASHLTVFLSQFHQLLAYQTCNFYSSEYNIFIIFTLLCYWLGFITFIMQVPEALWPGKFDTIFNGHQIMHIMIVTCFILQRYAFDCLRDLL